MKHYLVFRLVGSERNVVHELPNEPKRVDDCYRIVDRGGVKFFGVPNAEGNDPFELLVRVDQVQFMALSDERKINPAGAQQEPQIVKVPPGVRLKN